MKVRDFLGKHVLITAEDRVGFDEILLPWGSYTVSKVTDRAEGQPRISIYSGNEDLTTLYYDVDEDCWTAIISGSHYYSSSVYNPNPDSTDLDYRGDINYGHTLRVELI